MVYLDIASIDAETLVALAEVVSEKERRRKLEKFLVKDLSTLKPEDVRNITPISWIEDMFACLVFAIGIPGAAFTFPPLLIFLGYAFGASFAYGGIALLLILAFLPTRFKESNLYSWASRTILRYFSFKVIFPDFIPRGRRTILVAPPHGVFPFGNIVTMLAFPSIMGYPFRGIASSAALRAPVFRQMLEWIGVVDADRKNCENILNNDGIIGISTGGVAEVFETDAQMEGDGDECIVLHCRKGLVKLAFRTGSDLVPCYLFGNTKLLSCWKGGPFENVLRALSRSIKFATIFFWGRFLLAIPYRVPVLGVITEPIQVKQNDAPSDEDIERVHAELVKRMQELFDKHKQFYGWEKKRLVIK